MASRIAMRAIIALCAALAGTFGAFAAEEGENPFSEWLKTDAVRLDTVEPGAGFADMAPIRAMVGDARIVSMGEPTHGSREVFQMKHRMFEYLVTKMGFTIFGLEASYPECRAINEYVLHGEGDPEVALNGQRFWTWDTEEVLELILWMRAYNEDPAHTTKLKFYGFDMQSYTPAAETALDALAQADEAMAEQLRERVTPLMGPSAHQAMQAMTDEQWADAKQATTELLAAIDAHRAELAKAMGADAFETVRQHGVVAGQCVESMHSAIEPVPGLKNAEMRRLSGSINTIAQQLSAYLAKHDPVFHLSVKDKLDELEQEGLGIAAVYAEDGDETLQNEWNALGDEIATHLEKQQAHLVGLASQEAYDEAIARSKDVALAAQICRIWMEHQGEIPNVRDRCMAENIAWILEREGEDAKIMLWSHNLHAYKPSDMPPGVGPMGSELERMFGDDHVVFGFSFSEGSFQAIFYNPGGADDGKPALRAHTVAPAEEGWVGHAFAQAGIPLCVADLRTVEEGTPAHDWLRETWRMRTIGAVYSDAIAGGLAHNIVLPDVYDVIIFIEKTTRARPNALTRERFEMNEPAE